MLKVDLFRQFERLLNECPDHVILSEGSPETNVTVKELDERSGKVYRYLKEKGFGKEDVINIFLPRGGAIPICLFGVWKAGAAAVIIEDTEPEARVDFIRKDCGCAFVLDEQVWEEIQHLAPLNGHEPIDVHAAAFVVYTSGTTGNPKGVLHEYGRIQITYQSYYWNGEPISTINEKNALYYPMNFVASIMYMIISWMTGMEIMIVPYSVVRNPESFKEYLIEHEVTTAFFPPSFFRTQKDLGPYLKKVILSSEPADGIWRDQQELTIFNGYCSSETACGILVALLNKPNDIAPVGRPQYDVGVYLLDENGREVRPGETGELCFDSPFTRGYINLPEVNEKCFVNGVFYSGDLAKQGEDGQFFIVGRISDTVKINGRRIEPVEVEEAIRKVTDLKWVAVRGFVDDSRGFLSAYYLGDTKIDIHEIREKLRSLIPYYMLPSYLVKIDEIPRRPNGKLDRNALPRPSEADFRRDFVSPSNEVEVILCNAIEKILKVERVGINDDFFALGGDSLSSMQLILETKLSGLNFEDIYYGCTIEGIAKHYEERRVSMQDTPTEINERSMRLSHPLTTEQRYVLNYELYTPDTTMYNNVGLVRFEGVSSEALADALSKTIRNHPSLLTVFELKNGEFRQRYAPELMPDIAVERVTDEQLSEMKDTLVQPFGKMTDSLLWRSRVFEAPSGNYAFFEVHHALFDGTSYRIFMNDLQKCLSGEELDTDYYYYTLARLEEEMEGERYHEAKQYFEKCYGARNWTRNLPPDFVCKENRADDLSVDLTFTDGDYDRFEAATGLGRNGVYLTAGLLALHVISRAENVMITWIYNGRKDLESIHSIGILFHTLPLALRITDELTVNQMLDDVREQMDNAIRYSAYPFISSTFTSPVDDDCICFMLQDDIRDFSQTWKYCIEPVEIPVENRASQTSLDVEITTKGDEPGLYLDYSAGLYKQETIERYGELIKEVVQKLFDYIDNPNVRVKELL